MKPLKRYLEEAEKFSKEQDRKTHPDWEADRKLGKEWRKVIADLTKLADAWDRGDNSWSDYVSELKGQAQKLTKLAEKINKMYSD